MAQTATVLVVDDEPRIREVLQHALEREGFQVATAADGGDALANVAAGDVMLAVLRRRAIPGVTPSPMPPTVAPESETLLHGTLSLDVGRHEVRAGATRVDLTPTEFEVLRALLVSPGRLLSRNDLIVRAYKAIDGQLEVTERTIDTYVRRIRAKFRPHGVDPVETVHGLGYKARDLA